MALTVADLLAKLSLDTSGFRKGAEEAAAASQKMEGAANKASEATGKTEEGNKKAGKSFGDLSQSLNDTTQKFTDLLTPANLFGTVIGVTVVGALKSAVDHAFEFTSELRRLSLVTGDSLGRVAEFQGAVDKLGVGSDKLSRAFFFLSSEMENGGANLAKLGIELHTTEGYEKSVIDITQEMSDKFRAMGAGADVAAAARKILGRQAIDMLPVFQLEREQIRQLGEEEKRFSEQIGTDGLTAMTRFRGSLMEIGGAVTRVQTLLVLDLAPGFKMVADFTSAAVDSLLKVPAPVRHIGEAIAALTVSLIAATLATKAFAAALELAGLASWATGIGTAINAIRLLVAGLVLFITLGPMVKDVLVAILPQSVIDAWQSFTGMIGSAYQAMKNFIGLGPKEVLGPPAELATKKYEPTLADEQKRLQYTQQLTAAQIALGQATMTSEAAQVNAIKLTLKQRLDELAVQARFDTTPTNLARTAALRTAAEKTANAQIAQITQQANLQLLTIEEQTAEQRLAIEGKSRDAALAVRIDEIAQAKKLVADEYAAFGVSQEGYVNEAIRLNGLELAAKQAAITQEMTQVRAAQQLKALLIGQQVSVHLMTQAKADEELVKLQVDTDAKLLDLTTKAEATKREITNQNRELEKKAIQEELIFMAQAENRDLELKLANLETYKSHHADQVNVVVAATAEEYRLLKSAYDKDVQNYIDAQLYETGVLKNEVAKRVAQEAGFITAVKQLQQQYLDNQATILEQQARQVGDLGAAYQVGFTHAASSADDAFAVMRKAGADAYQSLKTGFSDVLYNFITGASTIGQTFADLGKRILRSMTDVFAEIIAKQALMAVGFSLPGLLGTAGTASAATQWQAATGPISNVLQLGNAASTASDALSGTANSGSLLTMAFSAITQTIGMFASGIVAVLQFIGSMASGSATGGAASFFGSGGGSLLSTLSSGLSSIFSALNGGFDKVLTGVFDLLTSGGQNVLGFGGSGAAAALGEGMGFIADAAPWIGAAYGLYQMFSGQLSPMSGALQGAAIGTMIAPGIGTAIGAVVGTIAGFLSGLFGGPTPEISGKTVLQPTTVAGVLGAAPAVHWGENGPTVVNPPGRSQFSYLDTGPFHEEMYYHRSEGQLSREQSQISIMNVILGTLQAAVKGVTALVPQMPTTDLSKAVSDRLSAVLAAGFEITNFDVEGDDAVQKFGDYLKALSAKTLEVFGKQMFPTIDLKALGGDDVVKGWDNLMAAMSSMGAIVKVLKVDTEASSVTLDQFAERSVAYFKQFAKEGEAFTDTIKRITTALSGILDLQNQVAQRQQALTGDVVSAIAAQGQALMTMIDNIGSLADALHVAVEANASPEEVQKAAQALLQAYDAAIQMAQQLKAELDALNSAIISGVDLVIDLTQKIDSLRGQTLSAEGFQFGLDNIIYLFNTLTDVTSRIALFAAALRGAADNITLLTANLPMAVTGFNAILDQIKLMSNPQTALGALKDLASAVESGLQAAVAGVQREAQLRIDALNVEKTSIQEAFAARKTALQAERDQIAKQADEQKRALQTQLQLVQQWASVASSVKSQLTDLFNLLAPTHPLTSLNEVRASFESAFSAFQAGPTPEGATRVQELAKQVLDLAKQTPGYELPGSAFQGLAGEVQTALQAIQAVTASQPSQEQIQAQIAALDQQQADSLAAIDKQLSALDADQTAQLAAIDQQIAATNAAAQAQIQQFQALAASGLEAIRNQVIIETEKLAAQQAEAAAKLQAVLGDKTFEQFIAEKQAEAATLLQGIDDTLKYYLGTIARGLGFAIPQAASGMAYVPQDGPVYLHRGERVLTAADNQTYSSGANSGPGGDTTVNISFTYAGSARKDEWDRFLDTVIDDARFGKLSKVIADKVKGR